MFSFKEVMTCFLINALNNNLTFTFYNMSNHSNFRIYRVNCVIVNLKFAMLNVCNSETIHASVGRPLKNNAHYSNIFILYSERTPIDNIIIN